MKLSIVTTLYYSSKYIQEFYERITQEVKKITDDYEIIFVNDGSPDDSLGQAIFLHKKDSKVKIIDLSRNFGHHYAIMTGLAHCRGDYIFLIDSDLEEEPELLSSFWNEINNEKDVDVIYGQQINRKGGWFEKITGKIFYILLNYLLDEISYPTNPLTARLMTKRYVANVISYRESDYDLWCIFAYTGYRQKALLCNKGDKQRTAYSLRKKMSMAVNIVASTSKKPLEFIFCMGMLISFLSTLYLIYIILMKSFYNTPMGWATIVAMLILIMGILIFSIGVLGIYISVIFLETKQRPIVIRQIYEAENE
jgi:putative glycosyltransferase